MIEAAILFTLLLNFIVMIKMRRLIINCKHMLASTVMRIDKVESDIFEVYREFERINNNIDKSVFSLNEKIRKLNEIRKD